MKKAIIIICTIGALLLIFDSVNAANSVLLFLFAGVIPGTNLSFSPIDMMALVSTAITLVILRLTLWPTLRTSFATPKTKNDRAKRTARRAA